MTMIDGLVGMPRLPLKSPALIGAETRRAVEEPHAPSAATVPGMPKNQFKRLWHLIAAPPEFQPVRFPFPRPVELALVDQRV